YSDVIPVDQLDKYDSRGNRRECVVSPEITVQERVRSAGVLQQLRPAGHADRQWMHPPEQTIAERAKLAWRMLAAESFEAANGIADVRREEGEAKVLAVLADLGQQCVSGAARAQRGDDGGRRGDGRAVGPPVRRFGA